MSIIDWLFRTGNADLEFLQAHATGVDELRRRAAKWPLARAAEVSGVEQADIERFAELYVASDPAVVRCGWGPERNRNGGSGVAAILTIPVVAGKLGVRGGGFTMSNSGAWSLDTERAINATEAGTREINMLHLGRALNELDDPPVKALVVYNCNPASTAPRQQDVLRGLRREDLFTVVLEQVLTDTAQYADVVLPATTFLEHREVRDGYGSPALFDVVAVADPVDEARPNYAVFADLCERLGLATMDDPVGTDALANAVFAGAGDDSARLHAATRNGEPAWPPTGRTPVQMVDVLPMTPDQKFHLVPESLDRQAPAGLYEFQADPGTEAYPLALISPASGKTVSSTFGQLLKGKTPVQIHPVDAEARSIRDGDSVRIWNDFGEVRCAAQVTGDVRPGVLSLPKGLWSRHTDNGATSNSLIPDTLADLGGGACFNDARVQIAAVTAATKSG
jgi:anaerobic selenocysteine-containing dehydrogenase